MADRNSGGPASDRTTGILCDDGQPIEASTGAAGPWLRSMAGHLRSSWRSAICSDAVAQRWASSSERHPNGFVKFVLQEWPNGSRLRLHVWAGARPVSDIHNHRWSFVSLPLIGTFEEHRYAVCEGNGILLVCDSQTLATSVQVRVAGPAGVVHVGAAHRPAGVAYGCDATSFHSFRPLGTGLAASLVYRGPAGDDLPLVWRTSAVKAIVSGEARIPTPPLSADEVRILLLDLLRST